MAKLKGYQVAAAAYLGGFRSNEIPTAVAVAFGESNWETTSANECCTGLWQIHRKAHAAIIGDQDLKDPVTNAKIAHKIYGGDWCGGRAPNGHCKKWEAYKLDNAGKTWSQKMKMGMDAYAQFNQMLVSGLPAESMVPSSGGGGSPLPDIPGLGDLADTAGAIVGFGKAVVDIINRVGAWISDPNSWLRVAEVIGGAILVTVGLRITFNRQINAVTKQIIQTVVPGGKAGAAAAAASAVKGRK